MTQATDVAVLPPALIKQFAEMVTIIPDFVPGGGADIIAQLLNATTLGDLDAPWSGGRKMPVGPLMFITGLQKAPSDFDGGLPFYLVVETMSPSSGDVKEFTAGGTMVVAQLVRAHVLDELPLAGVVVEVPLKDRPGQSAQHFKIDREETDKLRAAVKTTKSK